jgi:hypothetical protein
LLVETITRLDEVLPQYEQYEQVELDETDEIELDEVSRLYDEVIDEDDENKIMVELQHSKIENLVLYQRNIQQITPNLIIHLFKQL